MNLKRDSLEMRSAIVIAASSGPSRIMESTWYASLRQSLKKNERARESRYFQVASVDSQGRPTNRTVVYRGFLPTPDGRVDENVLTFVTDRRSEKVSHFQRVPWTEVAWYMPATREQYRISGKVRVVTDETTDAALGKARTMAWRNMSDPGRQQFLWPEPGVARTGDGNGEAQYNVDAAGLPTKDDPVAPAFCLCCVEVDRVSLLSLKSNERVDFEKVDGTWHATRVNP